MSANELRTRLNAKYRNEGWAKITDQALNIDPFDVESQARTVADWASGEISRLEKRFDVVLEMVRNMNDIYGSGDQWSGEEIVQDILRRLQNDPAPTEAHGRAQTALPTPRIEVFEYLGYNGGFAQRRIPLHRCELVGVDGTRKHSRSDSWHGYVDKDDCVRDVQLWANFTGWPVFDLGYCVHRDDAPNAIG